MRIERTMTTLSPDGSLVLDLGSPLNVRLPYGPWQAGLPVHRAMGGQWVSEFLDPGIPLVNPANDPDPDLPLQRFLAAIPPPIKARTGAYTYLQTTLLQWVARNRAAADLFERSPTLLWLLLSIARERRWTRTPVGELVQARRKEILRQLTGIKSQAAVRFLDRIVLHEGDYSELHLIDRFLPQQHLWRGLSQWPRIPVHVLAVLLRFPELQGSRLLRHLAERESGRVSDAVGHISRIATLWQDALRMANFLKISNGAQALARCPTRNAVERLHDRWVGRINRRPRLVEKCARPFGSPPIPGNDTIHPIVSEEDLVEEGRLMGHCVASYAERVRAGESYIYRVLHPERATLELRNRALRSPWPAAEEVPAEGHDAEDLDDVMAGPSTAGANM